MREIAARLEEAGHETWCVGGAVRDALLGITNLDWDLATAARPEQVRKLFRRTVPVGIEFGTVGVLDDDGLMHEVTTFRRDVRTDGRHAVVEFGASLDDDLARRDFTINAIAWSPSRRLLHDPYGGRGDLAAGVVRAVGSAAERMREDRLRALRAIRFAARFGFEIERDTWQAIVESAPHMGRLSAERVKQELEKTMDQVPRPSLALRRWRDGGALAVLVPALARVADDVLEALDFLPPPVLPRRPQRRINRLAMLFAWLPARDAVAALKSLRFSNQDTAWIAALAERWRPFLARVEAPLVRGERLDDVTLRRAASEAGRMRVAPLFRLVAARWAARRARGDDAPSRAQAAAHYRRLVRIAFRDPIEIGDLAVDGEDLKGLGIPPGPELRKILVALLDWVLEDPARNTRDALLARARQLWDAASGGAAAEPDS
ncbi:MAG: CCA tRNA nucleotidyltransferase [Gemmatimonadaceae bacterium]